MSCLIIIGQKMMNNFNDILDKMIPNPRCELNYNKDYELLIAVVLSAQTTDKRVNMVTKDLFNKYDIYTLAQAQEKDIIDIIRPVGTFKRKSYYIIEIAKRLEEVGDKVPNDREFLESLPGVGRKTANVVLSNIYNIECIAVDTHVHRVSIRLGLVNKNDDVLKTEMKLTKKFKDYNLCRLHHQLVLFGRYYCKASNPSCDTCKLSDICKYKNSTRKQSLFYCI